MLQARGELSESKVNGSEDVIVSDIISKLQMEKNYIVARFFYGQIEAPSSWKMGENLFF